MTNNNSQKGFAMPVVIAIIALVVIVGGIGYFATRTKPSPTVTTQTPADSTSSPQAGEKTLPDGTMVKADGTKVKPDGTIVKPDGTMVKTDGTMVKPDGTMVKPDGTIVKPDGTMIKPDGTMVKPDGTVVKPTSTSTEKKEGGATTAKYTGTVLAGKSAPLLDYNKADYDAAVKTDKLVVLYFYANWCPICKAETANALYPEFNKLTTDKVVGFRVNYNDSDTDSNEKALASQFGVAYQHTKVFVKNGQRILKSPEGWEQSRYDTEINKALTQ